MEDYDNHDCHLSEEDSCEACVEYWDFINNQIDDKIIEGDEIYGK